MYNITCITSVFDLHSSVAILDMSGSLLTQPSADFMTALLKMANANCEST